MAKPVKDTDIGKSGITQGTKSSKGTYEFLPNDFPGAFHPEVSTANSDSTSETPYPFLPKK